MGGSGVTLREDFPKGFKGKLYLVSCFLLQLFDYAMTTWIGFELGPQFLLTIPNNNNNNNNNNNRNNRNNRSAVWVMPLHCICILYCPRFLDQLKPWPNTPFRSCVGILYCCNLRRGLCRHIMRSWTLRQISRIWGGRALWMGQFYCVLWVPGRIWRAAVLGRRLVQGLLWGCATACDEEHLAGAYRKQISEIWDACPPFEI